MTFFLAYWKQLALAGAIIIVFGFGYYKGYEHEKLKYDAHLAEDARLVAIAKAESNRRVSEAQTITQEVTKEYANAVDKIIAYYKSHPHIIRMCSTASSSAMPSTSQSTSGTITAVEGTAEIDAQIASQEIAQCQALIQWELGQESIQ